MREGQVVTPSKYFLERNAKPIAALKANMNVVAIIAEPKLFDRVAPHWNRKIYETDFETGLVIALDGNGEFCGSYRL